MKRLAVAMAMGALVALLAVAPASAQYGGEPPSPPPPAPPSGCPVEDPPPADPPPCNPRRPATVSDPVVEPGEPVTVSTPPVFAPGTTTEINIVRIRRGADPASLGTATAAANGSVSESVTIPDLPPGVYFVYITGVDANGNRVVSLVPIIVRGTTTSAAAVDGDSNSSRALVISGSGSRAGSSASVAPVPPEVAEVQNLDPATEAALAKVVAQGAAGVVLGPNGMLSVRTPSGLTPADQLPLEGTDDISQQVTIGAALLLAGTGLVLLRRRRGGFTK